MKASVPPLLVALALSQGPALGPADLVYPGSRLLLERRATGRELEIHWSCHASTETMVAVVARYERDPRLERGAWRMHEGEHGFQSRSEPGLHLAIFAAADLPRHPSCRGELLPGERTVLQVSRGLPRAQTPSDGGVREPPPGPLR